MRKKPAQAEAELLADGYTHYGYTNSAPIVFENYIKVKIMTLRLILWERTTIMS
ncbi:MAG: hypothetical protein J6M30_09430 [Bacteroidales bacterium]|nr:hypothetical protein [Bacteroidales bacterium]MBP3254713.1 hypothetical protein [Bacteroidales bacterium]